MGRAESVTARYFSDRADGWAHQYASDGRFGQRLGVVDGLLAAGAGAASLPGRALDAGCGSGVFALHLAERGWTVHAVDASDGMVAVARRRMADAHAESLAVSFDVGRIEDLDVPSGSFDVVLCLSVLEYLDDDRRALRALVGALRPGGRLVLTVPNGEGLTRRLERLLDGVRRATGNRLLTGLAYLELQRHQYRSRQLDAVLAGLGLRKAAGAYWNVGLPGPRRLRRALERPRWAAMYGAAYVKDR